MEEVEGLWKSQFRPCHIKPSLWAWKSAAHSSPTPQGKKGGAGRTALVVEELGGTHRALAQVSALLRVTSAGHNALLCCDPSTPLKEPGSRITAFICRVQASRLLPVGLANTVGVSCLHKRPCSIASFPSSRFTRRGITEQAMEVGDGLSKCSVWFWAHHLGRNLAKHSSIFVLLEAYLPFFSVGFKFSLSVRQSHCDPCIS